jgi:hypothetical protein
MNLSVRAMYLSIGPADAVRRPQTADREGVPTVARRALNKGARDGMSAGSVFDVLG